MDFTGGEAVRSHPVLNVVANRQRRRLVALLQGRTGPADELDLATQLSAVEHERPLVDVTREQAEAMHVKLVHVHLPALADAGLVTWDRDDATVATTSHPVLDDPQFQRLVETDVDGWDAVVANLARRRRRIVLAVLEGRDDPMDRTDLATRVLARETRETGETNESADEPNDVLATLHHAHLPKLEQAGLVEYDLDDGTVTYEGHPALDETWFSFAADETPRSVLTDARSSKDTWTIEGRESVLERGRSIIDQADEEVFLLFTTDGLLEEECFRAFEAAVDRGVDVYLGSQTRAVRDLVRERTPEVTIWEPQLDWLNLPPQRERLGRLVFADRQAIMLATLGERNDNGVHAETAITGAGERNGLVVLMRELLGSRLDHLDAQSEDFRSQIPL